MSYLKKYFPLLLFVFSFLFLLKVLFLSSYPDFRYYYYSPIAENSGSNPYLNQSTNKTFTVYPPFTLLFFKPFTILPFQTAEKVWVIFSIIFLLASLYLIFKMYSKSMFSPLGLLLSSLTFLSFPLKFSLGMGQINLLILFLIVSFIYFLNSKRYSLSGVLIAIPILLKLFPLLLIPYLLILKKWRVLISFLLAFLLLSLITSIFIKPEITIFFLKNTLFDLLSGWKGDYYNQSISGLLMRNVSDTSIRGGFRFSISLILVLTTFSLILFKKMKLDKYNLNLIVGLIITLSLIINNFSWQHHFVWLIFPYLATFFFIYKKKLDMLYYILLFLSYLLVSINISNPANINPLFQSHVLYGALILWGLEIYLLNKRLGVKS